MRLVYFARVREVIGKDSEERAVNAAFTVAQLINQLSEEAEQYATAFADKGKLRFALDQQMVGPDTPLGAAIELAIFPPVTGG
jgi:sulfur-carrier protein